MSLFTADTHFVVYMNAKDPTPSQGLHSREALDPYYDLTRTEELAKRVPDLAMLHGGGVLIEYGEGKDAEPVVVRNQEMFEPIPLDQVRGGLDRFESSEFSGTAG